MIGPASNAAGGRGPVLATVLGVLFLTFLDTTIVSVVLGDVVADVAAGVVSLQWVVNAYALVFASLMLLGGALADRFGRKRVMLAGIAIFVAGSVTCALAPTVGVLITGRAVMGLGAAGCEPGTLSVIRAVFADRRQRARALGAWSAVSGLALALGPVIGGVLVGLGSWRWVFWFNLVVAALLLAAVARWVPESRDPEPGRLDVAGAVLAAAGLGTVIFAAISGEYHGYSSWWIVGLFVAGGLLLLALGPAERRAVTPLVDLVAVRRPVVASALFAAFASYFAVFAIFFLTALYLDLGLQYSGGHTALVFAPMAAAIVVGGLATGPWVARVGSRRPTTVGCFVAAAGILLARYELGHGRTLDGPVLSLALAVAGLGFGVTVVPVTSAVLGHLPARRAGMAASATNTARQLGTVVGVAALGAVVNAHLRDAVDQINPALVRLVGGREAAISLLQTGGSGSGGVDLGALAQLPAFRPFVTGFLTGLQLALLVAAVLVVLAGATAAFVDEPAPAPD